MNKFEQLIEYVINDEEQKARDLFHEIVVEKSRGIYEELMSEEEIEEAESTDDEDEKAEKAGRKVTKDIEYDDKKDRMDEEEELDEMMGGDQADDLIDDIETEEQGISMEGEDEEMSDEEMSDEEGSEELEDRVVDLEDKLDELMAEFEALMGDGQEGEDEMDMEVGSDDMEMDDMDSGEVETMDTEFETMEGAELEEAINLKAAPAPVKSEEGNINKKSTVAANSGARGMDGKPVMSSDTPEKGRPAPTAKDMISDVQNAPAKSTVKQGPATKPHLAQATGVNTKSPY
jgi:hypothetical protein